MPWIAAVAAVGAAAAGAVSASADRDSAEQSIKKSLDYLTSIGIPPIEAQKIVLEKYKSAGKLTPDLEQSLRQGDTNLKKVSLDPRSKQAQLSALEQLQNIGQSGGMTLAEKANLQKAESDIASRDKGRRLSVLDSFARRGLGGSGLELAANLQNSQDATNQEANNSLNIQANAQKRALDSIMASGDLGGKMRGQDYDEQSGLAQAQDAIDRFNTTNSQHVMERNTNRTNDANEFNFRNNQRLLDANTDVANKEQIHNKGLYQNEFDNRAKLGSLVQGAYAGQAANYNNAAERTGNTWSGISQGIGQMGAQYGADQRYNDYMDRAHPKKRKALDELSGESYDDSIYG